MAAYITQVKTLRRQLLRNAQATGAATARSSQGPMIFNELWGAAAIDATNLWTTTVEGTGTVTITTSTTRRVCALNTVAADQRAAIDSSLRSIFVPSGAASTAEIYKRLILEWEMQFSANEPGGNNRTAFGLVGGATNMSREANDLAAFGFLADVMQTVTDKAGTETETASLVSPTITNWNLYKIVVRNAAIDFYINGSLANTHTTNLPAVPLNAGFNIKRGVADAAVIVNIGAARMWLEDE